LELWSQIVGVPVAGGAFCGYSRKIVLALGTKVEANDRVLFRDGNSLYWFGKVVSINPFPLRVGNKTHTEVWVDVKCETMNRLFVLVIPLSEQRIFPCTKDCDNCPTRFICFTVRAEGYEYL